MAGALAVVAGERLPESSAVASTGGHWEVRFSRFFPLASRPSACPSLAPLRDSDRRRLCPSGGTWLSSSSKASLLLHPGPAAIITVCLGGKLLEQHFVSKLQFFRPQLSFMPEFPAMASRAVLVSYRDCRNEIQKFALRFSTTYETDSFTNSLKEILKDATEIELQNTHMASQISAQSEFTSYSPYRVQEENDTVSCIGIQNPGNLLILENESQQLSSNKETAYDRDADNGLASFPPSFTSFLNSCCVDREQATAQSTIPEVVDIKSQIMKYMEDSEFQEMLIRVDSVINEIGV
ncbi:protein POOR HOMOLOGOUS SYNAPSIS 1 isoform X1 [Syzygium oleosum]|uniref:protein POOR HOMOLOGOUS SYNAPSIS 1 isoform X1 n=1 Tax=Syzygium oleosum TaxID=219896 RepID=UPI0024BA92D6|nr:protein POOR HOMOLOGOUS SYNAPSIS 1 isoform X1 [Syzygium oleosum]